MTTNGFKPHCQWERENWGSAVLRCCHLPRRSTLPWCADPRRRLARTTTTPLYQDQPSRGTASEAVNSRQPSFCGCGSRHLEQTANWRRRCKFTVSLSSTVKTFYISAIISWFSILTLPNQWSLQWLCHLGQFKKSLNDWMIDWFWHQLRRHSLFGNPLSARILVEIGMLWLFHIFAVMPCLIWYRIPSYTHHLL